ncbi:protein FAM199X-like [Mercenaria mercenaria]|uniref:protein FAM199X-like n=1 Tax=Mercenaria mercenaria TaxID=6596 RepID=UPI00234E74EF|nr:protein FAM199X-like [Mercenaria mercenaria]
MLSDAPFTSPWSSDVFITGDYKLPAVEDSDEDDSILDLYKSTYEVNNNQWHVERVSGSSSMTAGSECSSDELYIDGDDDAFVFDIESDVYMQGLESNLNDFIDSSCNVNWSDDDDDDDDDSNSSIGSSGTCSPDKDWSPTSIPAASQAFTCSTIQPSSKCQSRRLKNTPCKKWSHMTKSQKAKTVDELSLTISNDLGLREQMEIIKVINPAATFSKQTTQFVIDLNTIDDIKLEKIQDIVNFHCVQSNDITDNHNSHSSNRKFSKKNKSQDRKPKVPKQRIQKEYRQKLKEKRSGLFVKEERLAVSETIMEEDIDILG